MKKLFILLTLLAPVVAVAAPATDEYSKRICLSLIADITRNYNVSDVDLIPKGYKVSDAKGPPTVNCMYSAYTSGGYSGRLAVAVFADLNTSSGELTVEID